MVARNVGEGDEVCEEGEEGDAKGNDRGGEGDY